MSSNMKSTILLLSVTFLNQLRSSGQVDPQVKALRSSFMDMIKVDKEMRDSFHPKDIQMIKTNDWWLERFNRQSKTEDKALSALVKALSWRRSYGVNDFNDKYFAREVHAITLGSTYCKDLEGRPVVYVKGSVYRRTDLSPMLWQFMVYQFEKADRQSNEKGWTVLMDANGQGAFSADRKFMEFFVDVISNNYPLGVKNALVVDMPKVQSMMFKIMIRGMSKEMKSAFKFIRRGKLTKYLQKKDIPKSLGGQYDLNKLMANITNDFKPLDKIEHGRLTDAQVVQMRQLFSDELWGMVLS